jgi:hypothetical protein
LTNGLVFNAMGQLPSLQVAGSPVKRVTRFPAGHYE